jgi:hypothetical protein
MKVTVQLFNIFLITAMHHFAIAQTDLVINQDAINVNYNHYNGSILIEPLNSDITVSGNFVFQRDAVVVRSVTVKAFNNHTVTIIPATVSFKSGVVPATRLAGCGEDHQIPPTFPAGLKSLFDNQLLVLTYEIYDITGQLIKKENEQTMPFEIGVQDLPKNRIYIVKLMYNDGTVVTEKRINR